MPAEYVVFKENQNLYKGDDLEWARRICEENPFSKMREFNFDPENNKLTISGYAHGCGGVKYIDKIEISGKSLDALLGVMRDG
jgi:hypothetical protein